MSCRGHARETGITEADGDALDPPEIEVVEPVYESVKGVAWSKSDPAVVETLAGRCDICAIVLAGSEVEEDTPVGLACEGEEEVPTGVFATANDEDTACVYTTEENKEGPVAVLTSTGEGASVSLLD